MKCYVSCTLYTQAVYCGLRLFLSLLSTVLSLFMLYLVQWRACHLYIITTQLNQTITAYNNTEMGIELLTHIRLSTWSVVQRRKC